MPSSSSQPIPPPLSNRPFSAPPRPSSSASNRPISSAGHRPPSILSQRRPVSRLSQHPQSRQPRSRLIPLCKTLILRITNYSEDSEKFIPALDYALKNLESTFRTKASAGVDIGTIDRHIRGHCQKSRIHSREHLSEALSTCYAQLKNKMAEPKDLDDEIKVSHLPDHMQLLLSLSQPAGVQTLSYANNYLHCLRNPPIPPPALTWKEVLADERAMNSLDPDTSSADYGLEGSSNGSEPSLSPWTSEGEDDDESSFTHEGWNNSEPAARLLVQSNDQVPREQYAHREAFDLLRSKQYWRVEWRQSSLPYVGFDLGDPSTLGPAMREAMSSRDVISMFGTTEPEHYMDEHDMVREVLMALQGRSSIIFEEPSEKQTIEVKGNCPRLRHLSVSTQQSILTSFAKIITTLGFLRSFVSATFEQSNHGSPVARRGSKPTRTLDAFADALFQEILLFDSWCAEREEKMLIGYCGSLDINAQLVVSLLSTEQAVKLQFAETFDVLLDIVHVAKESGSIPAAITTTLLDRLHESMQVQIEKGGTSPSPSLCALVRVFTKAVEPLWQMIGRWLSNGMDLGDISSLDEEFFIDGTAATPIIGADDGLLDPSFWAEGFVLRERSACSDSSQTVKMIPEFLRHVAEPILAAGKAVGLLRILDCESPTTHGGQWPSFRSLLQARTIQDSNEAVDEFGTTADDGVLRDLSWISASVDSLSRLVYDSLITRCGLASTQLVESLLEECQLWHHLLAIEGVYLSRQADMANFYDILLGKMDSSRSWADFHFVNTAFTDVIEANRGSTARRAKGLSWVYPSLVRLSYRSPTKDKEGSIHRTVKAIDGLAVEYAVPFPLSYIFTPSALEIYAEIFVFLLQLRRAKYVLDKILIRSPIAVKSTREELKVLYALRSRFSWIVNTLLNFFVTFVIQSQVERFHKDFIRAKSLDQMIQLHEEHLSKIKGRCLLNMNTSALHRGILSILDLSLHFSTLFTACAGDNGLDVSRQSITMRPHRSRRRRKDRRNTIWFAGERGQQYSDSSDEDSDSALDHGEIGEREMTTSVLTEGEDGSMPSQLDKLSRELDGVVRFLRRGVESLAGSGGGGTEGGFGVLGFALEDWDA